MQILKAPNFQKIRASKKVDKQRESFSANTDSSTSVNFQLPILPLFVQKIILTNPTNTSYTSTIFPLSYFCVQASQKSTPKIFSLPQPLSKFRLHQGTREHRSPVRTNSILFSPFSLKVWTVITGLTIIDSLLLRLRKMVYSRYYFLMKMLAIGIAKNRQFCLKLSVFLKLLAKYNSQYGNVHRKLITT